MSPQIDVSIALTNPYTLDYFTVHRTKEIINQFGESHPEVLFINCVPGVVYPKGANRLMRRPEAEVQAKTIEVITRFALRGESECQGTSFQPDVVKWNGSHFLVTEVEDYANFASGHVKCTCTARDIVDRPPDPRLELQFSMQCNEFLSKGTPIVFQPQAGTTILTLPGTPVGSLWLAWNGDLLTEGVDYYQTDNTITLMQPSGQGDRYMAFYAKLQPACVNQRRGLLFPYEITPLYGQTKLTLPARIGCNFFLYWNGDLLSTPADYTLSGGTITLAQAVARTGDRFLIIAARDWMLKEGMPCPLSYVAGPVQNQFTLPCVPQGAVWVFWNGVFLSSPADYHVDGATVNLTQAASLGDRFLVFYEP